MSALAVNYAPLDIDIADGEGVWITDTAGNRYIDCLAGYSALNFGHRNPELTAAAHAQLDRVTLTARAIGNDRLLPFAEAVTALTGTEMLLPMNTGAEAVETAIKTARKWGYDVKGVPRYDATIIVAANAFHGRTTTIISMSTDPEAREGFGPYTPGFRVVPYGDPAAVAEAIDETTVAVLVEPVQGEAGVIIPPEDYLGAIRATCTAANVLLVLDEIQSGLGRTGATLTQDLSGVRADLTTLGKALGGGIIPTSALVGRRDVIEVVTAGTHGSTFGGNPLACAVGLAVTKILGTGYYQERARTLSPILAERAKDLVAEGLLTDVRCLGLWMGVDVANLTGRQVSIRLAERGVIAKETHGNTIRFAPPLCVTEDELHQVMDALTAALRA
ncbi:ornithine--oxo-acid transaminase [Occultella aeris]|uniref:ornithine aminotransferase n=1 Tax=Occultella aeris TaxID=2761496 RepID=A0A7M4DIH5_9MICO|nr:ornithine--oxo-acid transaminase [Occultella aeris]VZO36748.1 Ornithine aminotransferase [Occultella aeris]